MHARKAPIIWTTHGSDVRVGEIESRRQNTLARASRVIAEGYSTSPARVFLIATHSMLREHLRADLRSHLAVERLRAQRALVGTRIQQARVVVTLCIVTLIEVRRAETTALPRWRGSVFALLRYSEPLTA